MENNKMPEGFAKLFTENQDETGRHLYYSHGSGKTYYIEPIGDGRGGDWGSENPATKEIEHKKGDGKFTGSVTIGESLITPENGFKEIHHTEVGESPYSVIERIDAQYPRINDVSFKGSK